MENINTLASKPSIIAISSTNSKLDRSASSLALVVAKGLASGKNFNALITATLTKCFLLGVTSIFMSCAGRVGTRTKVSTICVGASTTCSRDYGSTTYLSSLGVLSIKTLFGSDLLVMQDVSLNQALTGFSLRFTHLDGRDVIIKTKPGEVIQSETKDPTSGRSMPYMMMVPGEGMPSRGNPFVKGNLYVAFHIEFPKTLSKKVAAQLRDLLPDANMEEDYDADEVEEHFMVEADLRHFGKGGAEVTGGEYDSDDEDGQQGVQCQQS
jgi:hypothetical protein